MQDAVPEVSIILPAHNEESSIDEAVGSILSQTCQNWELIVIDDASTDNTFGILSAYQQNDNRIVVIQNSKQLGLPGSLNRGIERARSNIIARADADDISDPIRLEIQLKYLSDHPDVDVLGCGAWLLDVNGKNVRPVNLPQSHEELKNLPFNKTHFFHSSVVIRKRFFDKVGLYDAALKRAQDKELWLRGLKNGAIYGNLDSALIKYRTNNYERSWKTIIYKFSALMRIASRHKPVVGHIYAFMMTVYTIMVKYHIYKPASLKR